jgi:hypothetical protein
LESHEVHWEWDKRGEVVEAESQFLLVVARVAGKGVEEFVHS